jgi:hypothetical protein
MTQPRLNFGREKKPLTRQGSGYDRHNLECARLMLADPEHYPGLQLEWAKTVVRDAQPDIRKSRALPGI